MSLWSVRIEDSPSGQTVEIYYGGSWFSDADDLHDAEGILSGQKVTRYTLDDNGYATERTL